MKQKIKNIFKKPTKKALGKLGLFLIFGFFAMNVNFYCKNEINKDTAVYFGNFVYAAEEWWLKDYAETLARPFVQLFTNPLGYGADTTKLAGSLLWGGVKSVAGGVADLGIFAIDEVIKYLVESLGGFIDSVLSQEFFDTLVRKNENVYKGWTIVRDMLNMFFMFLLLFSAFATIFQVEKYHLRKVIIMLIVMALLVNFSFPITAFIIDFSNSAMYFLLDLTFGGNISSTAKLAEVFSYGHVLASVANKGGITTTSALLTLIFDFIMMVTFIALLINLLIRILAFMILMILSPAGFVFAFFPDTKSIASKWWSALFKYAFFGPIMAFFLYLAVLIFSNTGNSVNLTFIGSVIAFLVPITFLWMGLIFSQQFGGEGSGVAMNMVKKTGSKIKGYGQTLAWGGVKLGGRGVDTMAGHRISGGIGAIKSRWNQFGDDYKSRSESRAAQFGSTIGVRGAKEKDMKRRAEEYKKNNAEENELKNLAKRGDAAAAYRLAEDKNMDQETYDKFMEISRDNSLRKAINSKTKQTRMDLVAVNVAETTINSSTELDKFKEKNPVAKGMTNDQIRSLIVNQEMGKLSAEDYSNQDWKAASERVNSLIAEGRTNDANNIKNAVSDAFKNLPSSAKNEMAKRLNGQKAAILKDDFNVITL